MFFKECDLIQHSQMKEKIRKEYYRRVRLVLKSELNAANRIQAITTLAVPVVAYSFNVINWKMSEIRKMDAKIRKLLMCERMHHPKADVDRLYVPRNEGGRGLTQLETVYKTSTIGLNAYLENTNDRLLKLVYQHETKKKLYSVNKETRKFRTELGMPEHTRKQNEPVTNYAKRVKSTAKQKALEKLKDKWEGKPMHGQYPERVGKPDINQDSTPSVVEKLWTESRN